MQHGLCCFVSMPACRSAVQAGRPSHWDGRFVAMTKMCMRSVGTPGDGQEVKPLHEQTAIMDRGRQP